MALGNLQTEGDLEQWVKRLLDRLGIRPQQQIPRFLVATRPAASAANEGLLIYVKDAAAGSKFQGSDGSSWVSLG